MIKLTTYIIEKLKINKDSKLDHNEYILLFKKSNKFWSNRIFKTIKDVYDHINKDSFDGQFCVYECPSKLIGLFIDKWDSSPENIGFNNVAYCDKKFKKWIKENDIKQIKTEEIFVYEKLKIDKDVIYNNDEIEIVTDFIIKFLDDNYHVKFKKDYDFEFQVKEKNNKIYEKLIIIKFNTDIDIKSSKMTEMLQKLEEETGYDYYWSPDWKNNIIKLTNSFI